MSSKAPPSHPGTTGIWTFVFIDMVVFFMFFTVFIAERHRIPEIFAVSQRQLDPFAGLVSTIALLSSSWCMAEAVRSLRQHHARSTVRWIDGALLLALGFVANKLFEYGGKLAHGISPTTDGFFTLYFLITGIHFLHVLAGMIFMAHCRMSIAGGTSDASLLPKVENVGLFWHFVDVLWLFIFPMLYLTELLAG